MSIRPLCFVLAAALPLACSSSAKAPANVSVQGRFAPAAGLSPGDFEIEGPADTAGTSITADGSWQATGLPERTSILFAGPKVGSAASVTLGTHSGLYMSPLADDLRLIKAGAGYSTASSGEAILDATSTVFSMLLMHPALAHPSAEVSSQVMQWMATRLASGWPCLTQAAAAYDADLLAMVDFTQDPAFTTPFATCLEDAADMPEIIPAKPTGSKASLRHDRRTIAVPVSPIRADSKDVPVEVAQDHVVVGNLNLVSVDAKAAIMEPETDLGTSLEYYYTIKALDPSVSKLGTGSPAFTGASIFDVNLTGATIASGFLNSSSYWGYLDVVGKSLDALTNLAAGVVMETPNKRATLPATGLYEVRLFSGGIGSSADPASFIRITYQKETNLAMVRNMTMAVVEVFGVVPGASEILAEGDAGKILQDVTAKAILGVQALLSQQESVSGDDVFAVIYDVVQTAVNGLIDVATQTLQEGAAKKALSTRFMRWFTKGGEKVIKAFVNLPGRVAKAGSLGNRALRLANPESIAELFVIAVGYRPGNCEPFLGAMAAKYGTASAECKACADVSCGEACTACGESCVGVEANIAGLFLATCSACNESGRTSTACLAANGKLMTAVAYTPGAGQPEEKASNIEDCIERSCAGCFSSPPCVLSN